MATKRGGVATKPTFQAATDPAAIQAQIDRTNKEIQKRGGIANAPGYAARLKELQAAQTGAQQQQQVQNNQTSYNDVAGQSNQQMQNLIGQAANQPSIDQRMAPVNQQTEQIYQDANNRANANYDRQNQRNEQQWGQRTAQNEQRYGQQYAQNEQQFQAANQQNQARDQRNAAQNQQYQDLSNRTTAALGTQDYATMRQKAESVAMDSFNRNMQPQFQQEEAAFRQRMAEQGIDPNSEGAQRQFKQLQDNQNSARQNAMTNAFQLGQGEQAQQYGQAWGSQQQAFNQAQGSQQQAFGQQLGAQGQAYDQYLNTRNSADSTYQNAMGQADNQYQGNQMNAFNQQQSAQNQAYNQRQGVQDQQFGQASNQAMMPYQQLGAMMPIYQYQNAQYLQNGQQQFTGNQNELDRQNQQRLVGMQNQGALAVKRMGMGGGGYTTGQRQEDGYYNDRVANSRGVS